MPRAPSPPPPVPGRLPARRLPWGWIPLALLLATLPRSAQARSVEPGAITLGLLGGPSFSLGRSLGASAAYGSVGAQAEYHFDAIVGAVFDLVGSFGSNVDLRLHIGPRWRLARTALPLLPYAQIQFAMGRLYNVLGADLQFLGGRLAVGADYAVTHAFTLGLQGAADVGSTAGERPAFYGVAEAFVTASWMFGGDEAY